MISKTTNRWSLTRAAGGLIFTAGLALACTDTTGPVPTYTVGATVSGLTGSGLVLRDNDGDDLSVTANGPVVFAMPLASGASYSVTVLTQPSSPAQTCVVTGGSGTVAQANVTTVGIVCATNTSTTYTVGGTVSGLAGSGLVLRDNDGDDLPVTANGPVVFPTPLSRGAAYRVTVSAQPTTPAQICIVTRGSGAMPSANVTAVGIVCVTNAGLGAVRVIASTAGVGIPLTYTVGVDPGTSGSSTAVVPANGAVSVDLAPGAHTVSLQVAFNCIVTSPNPIPATVASGLTTNVVFSVTCVARGTIRVTVATTGPNAPATYIVRVNQDPAPGQATSVSANGTVSFLLASGSYTAELLVPSNCTVASSEGGSVTVTPGATTDVAFSVTCGPLGTIRVRVATTGTNAPATFVLTTTTADFSESHHSVPVPSNGTISFSLLPGSYTVGLVVPANCTGGGSLFVSLASGATIRVAFTVTCVATGTLRVTAATTGPNAPPTHSLGVESEPRRLLPL